MDMKSDRYGYLKKTGAIGVCAKAIPVSGSSRGKGALGSASEEKKGLAKRANLEGNESAHYEKLEKRSLRSLKEGGSEKELRRGHNLSLGDLNPFGGGSDGPSAAEKKVRRQRQNVRKVAKSGITVDAAKNPVLAAKVAKKRGVAEPGAMKAARAARSSFSKDERKESKQSYKTTVSGAKNVLKKSKSDARANMTTARDDVKAARGALRDAMQTRRKSRKGLGALV